MNFTVFSDIQFLGHFLICLLLFQMQSGSLINIFTLFSTKGMKHFGKIKNLNLTYHIHVCSNRGF